MNTNRINKLICSLMAMLFTACLTGCQQPWGSFSGPVVTEWLDDGRNMRLVKSFQYTDPSNEIWDAPAGSIVDGASIPKLAWSVIVGPFEGKYRKASVIHDVACEKKVRRPDITHRAFYTAMRASGVDLITAEIMYGAVYWFGPSWISIIPVQGSSKAEVESSRYTIIAKAGIHNKVNFAYIDRKVINGTKKEILDAVCEYWRAPQMTLPSLLRSPSKAEIESSWNTIMAKARTYSNIDIANLDRGAISKSIDGTKEEVLIAVIIPPERQLKESSFDELKKAIEKNNLSLEEIENYFPTSSP
jgi:hypothetical protein